jgi:predicted Zn-dependent protease
MSQIRSACLDPDYFGKLSQYAFGLLQPKEFLFLTLAAEESQFVRLNQAKVRQIGTVQDSILELSLVYQSAPGRLHKNSYSLTLSGLGAEDQARIKDALRSLQSEVQELPCDPYAELPRNAESSHTENRGELLGHSDVISELLAPLENTDLAGLYSSGPVVRAMAHSEGQKHWFYTENFSLDYSLYTQTQRALKGTYAGSKWNREAYGAEVRKSREQLALLNTQTIRVPKGAHRVYLAPAATYDLITMLNWGALSEASIRQGDSPLRKLQTGEKKLSPLFSLEENFQKGGSPRFNSEGELAPERLSVIDQGQLQNSLVSSRTALEYHVKSNQACSSETLRAPVVAAGTLQESEILKKLDKGLYLSNLHYLNWSDQPGGRITGMTRYACFWVENGKLVAPMESLRFDDTIFNLFGESLLGLTQSQTWIPEVGSYEMRDLGGMWCPGMLMDRMTFTF